MIKKTIYLLAFSALLICYASAQTKIMVECSSELELIKNVPYIPELSGDSIYWSLVIQGKDIVPCLIFNLTNIKKTNIAVPNFGGYYCLGDIAFSILCQIIRNIPIEKIIRGQKKYPLSEDATYWSFVSYNKHNRRFLKNKIIKWYEENENKLIWVVDTNNYRTSKDWYYKFNKNPAHGYYILPCIN